MKTTKNQHSYNAGFLLSLKRAYAHFAQ